MKYPEDLLNNPICGNCLEIIDYLPNDLIDGVLIDPPYGEGMGYEGDDTLGQAEVLLSLFLKNVEPKIKRNGHIAIFWTMRNLDVCIDTLRSSGFYYRRTLSMYLPKGNARPYLGWLPRTQAIVIGQNKQPSEFHHAMTQYLNKALETTKITKSEIAKHLGCDSRLVMKWTRTGDPSWCLPTPRFYKRLKEILNLDSEFDILLDRKPSHTNNRTDFSYKHDTYVVNNNNDKMLHPSQKPLEVIEHLVTCLSPANGVIFDGFAGSGTTALACKNTGRNFITTEISSDFHSIIKDRLNGMI